MKRIIYVSGPAAARLNVCSRMTVNERMRAGAYGELLRRGRVFYARVDAIERHAGTRFSTEQIEAAVAGRPDRLLTITTET
jgi:hypothetical protein